MAVEVGEGLKGVSVNKGLLRRREKRWGKQEKGRKRGERRKYLKSDNCYSELLLLFYF